MRDGTGLGEVGRVIGPGWFREGQWVDARSRSRGMGFAGVSLAQSGCFRGIFWEDEMMWRLICVM